MAAKEILFDTKARAQIAFGLNTLANAVKVTLGPRGRNVVIEKSWGSPTVTKDGVTVAKEIELDNKFENMGAQMVREVASKTSDVAGDGTTTSTVLAEAIFLEAYKYAASGANVTELNRVIRQASEAVVAALKHNRIGYGCDTVQEYVDIAWERIHALRAGTLRMRPMGKPVYDPRLPRGGHQ